jgi:ABC-type multidrug transport system ATPase subunit
MEMLATEQTPEYGSLALENRRLTMADKKVDYVFADGSVAYCPQFDALFPKKSVAEHLQFYARVRGLDPNNEATKEHISAIVRLLGLGRHLNKLSTAISGGYKRRTCLAIAMIGYPKLMMIDECTTGTC